MAKTTQKSSYGYVIPDNKINELARCVLPVIQRFFGSEDGKREFEKWKEEQTKAENEAD